MNLKILPKLMVAATLSIITPNNDANASAHTPPSCLTSGVLPYKIDFDKTKVFIDAAQTIAPDFMKDFMKKQLPEKEKGIIGREGLSEGVSYSLWNALVSRTLGIEVDKTAYREMFFGYVGDFDNLVKDNKLRENLWRLMKEVNFITSEIADQNTFIYDQVVHFKNAVAANPGKPIIFGCGQHSGGHKYWNIPEKYTPINCGSCEDRHEGAITVDTDPTQLPTVIADARKPALLQSVAPGSIPGIIDESQHNIFFHDGWNQDLMTAVYKALAPGATFSGRYMEPQKDEIIAQMMGLGFDYKSPDGYIFIFTKTA